MNVRNAVIPLGAVVGALQAEAMPVDADPVAVHGVAAGQVVVDHHLGAGMP